MIIPQIQIQFKKRKQSPHRESDFKVLLYACFQQEKMIHPSRRISM